MSGHLFYLIDLTNICEFNPCVVESDGYIYKSGQCHPGLTYILNF